MLREGLIALAFVAGALTPADYQDCKTVNNGPIVKQKPPAEQYGRQPDVAALQPTAAQCSAPIPVAPSPNLAPNSTFYSDGEPPARFAHVPNVKLQVRFGQAAIDELCGRPPCGMRFLGCSRGPQMALPDPYSMDSAQFAKIVRHELGHVNGWPATHGS